MPVTYSPVEIIDRQETDGRSRKYVTYEDTETEK